MTGKTGEPNMKNRSFLKFEGLDDVETLSSILDAIHEAIVIMARDSTIVYANQAYTRILGVPVGRIIGRKLIDIEPTVKCLESLKTQQPIYGASHFVKSRGIHIMGDSTCIYSGDAFVGIAMVFRDVTEVVHLNKKLNNLQKYADTLKEQLDFYSRENLPETFREILGKHPGFVQALKLASQVAQTEATVLIEGESGVGKDLLAKAIHDSSLRKDKAFVAVNCAAIPETLFESELFGYAPGSFTGANLKGKKGKFLLAHEGTIFLDEVGELPHHMQAKLLRVLQNGEVDEIGSPNPVRINLRVIAATNQDLQQLISKGKFRQDLYYRLNIVPIYIPPLREHPQDILLLADHFLKEFNEKYHKQLNLDTDAVKLFLADYWPGNVRELQNVIRHAVIIANGSEITLEDLPPYFTKRFRQGKGAANEASFSFPAEKISTANLARDGFIRALQISNNNRSQAMKILGISRGTFYKKFKEYGLATLKVGAGTEKTTAEMTETGKKASRSIGP